MLVECWYWMNRAGAVVAKYGDKSVYFDLEDLGNTTGQWDLYGSDAPSPYNSLQVCHSFFTLSKARMWHLQDHFIYIYDSMEALQNHLCSKEEH
jgi:hypothetical protein